MTVYRASDAAPGASSPFFSKNSAAPKTTTLSIPIDISTMIDIEFKLDSQRPLPDGVSYTYKNLTYTLLIEEKLGRFYSTVIFEKTQMQLTAITSSFPGTKPQRDQDRLTWICDSKVSAGTKYKRDTSGSRAQGETAITGATVTPSKFTAPSSSKRSSIDKLTASILLAIIASLGLLGVGVGGHFGLFALSPLYVKSLLLVGGLSALGLTIAYCVKRALFEPAIIKD